MEITNNFNLPTALVRAIKNDTYKRLGDISVTGLIKPPRIRILEKRYWHLLKEDASDRIWSLLGQSVHSVLHRGAGDNDLAEEVLTATIDGKVLKGEFDLLEEDKTLTDYKVTSVWAFLREKPEWTAQLSVYRYLLGLYGFEVRRARIVAILRDWSRSRLSDEDYPRAPVYVRDIETWSAAASLAYIKERMGAHFSVESLPDNDLPRCTGVEVGENNDMWEKPAVWAVKKRVNKRALKLCSSEDGARAHVAAYPKPKELEVVLRPGERMRCERYCSVNRFCNQFREYEDKNHMVHSGSPDGA